MIEITREQAAERIALFASERRLIRGQWHHYKEDGKEFACLLGSIHSGIYDPADCPASVMPRWMAELLVILFDSVSGVRRFEYGARFSKALLAGFDPDLTKQHFLSFCDPEHTLSAKPAPVSVAAWASLTVTDSLSCELLFDALLEGMQKYA